LIQDISILTYDTRKLSEQWFKEISGCVNGD